ncbi:MAG: hypothetical protein ACXWM7_08045 [Parachlamydiaceae bacterium]
MFKSFLSFCCFFLSLTCVLPSEEYVLFLRDNLRKAQKGDFIVTSQGKNYSVLYIYGKTSETLTIEEISIPTAKVPRQHFSWSSWIETGAPGNSSHAAYTIDLATGKILKFYTFLRGQWYEMASKDAFLSTLLNLRFSFVQPGDRRRIGMARRSGTQDNRSWNPRMIVNGQSVEGVRFDVWKTHWPKDGSELSGKMIEVYLPEEGYGYPSYFPYWLQISGLVGGAKVRIVDSGTGFNSSTLLPMK